MKNGVRLNPDRRVERIVVIGSGPAGVAAAQALCDAGLWVTSCWTPVTDRGGRMRSSTSSRVGAGAVASGASADVLAAFPGRHPARPAKTGIRIAVPVRGGGPDLPIATENAKVLLSLAYGGLSNAWGASMLPFRQADIEDWPIALKELEPHYEAVLRFVPIAAEHDDRRAAAALHRFARRVAAQPAGENYSAICGGTRRR